jgi:protein-tyrosine phosphatase
MIDIHTHVLPGVDDGPLSMEATAAMLSMAAKDGITDLVATPHADMRYRFDPDHCRNELSRVRAACPDSPRLSLGCELHLTPENLDAALRKPSRFTLNGGNYLLVELPDAIVPQGVESALRMLLESGLFPIIAHPERNAYIQKHLQYASRLVEFGCYLQITAQSLNGSFGASADRIADQLLKDRLVHFVASDAHGFERRRPLLGAPYADVVHRCGKATAHALFHENPRAALASEQILPPQTPKKSFLASLLPRNRLYTRHTSTAPNLLSPSRHT